MKQDLHERRDALLSAWKLADPELIGESRLACLWKVRGEAGARALKLYKGPNMGSERYAVQFLECLDPSVAVRVHDVDDDLRAVLLEWLPGATLSECAGRDPETALDTVLGLAEVIRRTDFGNTEMFKPATRRLANLETAEVSGDCAPRFARDIGRAKALSQSLQSDPQTLRPIHGDLRFDNVIMTPEGPRLIDPKAQIGETAFEVAHVFWHGVEGPDGAGVMKARAERYAARVGTTPERLLQWAAVKLALYISFQSGGVITTEPRAPLLSCLLDLAEA